MKKKHKPGKEHQVTYFAVSIRLISDKGKSVTNKTFQDFVKRYGIKYIQDAVATPSANGQAERLNRTILDALSTSGQGGDDKSWDEHISDIQVGINTTRYKTTLALINVYCFVGVKPNHTNMSIARSGRGNTETNCRWFNKPLR
ncbi:hypothetical protein O3G_MSEX013248 [Manduca sexta]|uniref:Integrase catalytic domain-containing protein n=1 Tax=Manduca sexta TaxID=7130 RepID=A0A921ZS45_MANSE|nr:hypothetical protein O3G_MSEX013248 [Manduca sexta]